ncbi:oleandomycin transport system ATP-binding protein [Actinokineospora alba]|uniref:Oleandomycin transport system ATP-binding protein n=1 Tax=Actinokineospora alba TaxID=504798 RepID=A0A1H0SUT0_9PSEU|nr:ATP-binding cassette domain-containing protein [Actinokineospora alba]TDP66530.1 oleandomycin transport system ATP-binding protein [Actinokineospora alba]SDJ37089.1 oleandomycin transport system ATP-binding protein [Actinokineospora alba]SDP45380.1 oleandomycin transport system ATP-binding protein [Actinokineospora alba]
MSNAIEAEGLVKRFGDTVALDGVDLMVPKGKVLGVLGPNGAGKTTAVRVLATLLRADEGSARVCGFDVRTHATTVRGLIGLTGQYASLDEDLSGTENLVLIGKLLGLTKSQAKARSAELLAQFELTDAAGRAVKTYSGGMRRRADLAAGLVGRPEVLYLDEPTTGLDPHSRNEVWSTIRGLVDLGVTVLLTTQYLEEADQLADLITVIDHGKVIATGTPDDLKRRTGGQTLQVRPTLIGDVAAVASILRGLAGEPHVDLDTGLLTAPVDDPMLLSTLVRRLDDAGITVDELALRLPSLDEVFLAMTGRTREGIPA